MKMKAAVTRAPRAPMSLETLEIEAPRANEVLIRISAVGVCHTDISMRDQLFPVPQPIVLGHEGSGVIEAVGSDAAGLAVGDHVVISYATCGGECAQCKSAAYAYCEQWPPLNFGGARPDGSTSLTCGTERVHSHFFGQSSFAEYAVCSAWQAVKVPKDAPLELLGPLGCGVMTGAGAVIHGLDVGVGESIAVFGVGSVGLSAVMAARLVGAATIIAVDFHGSPRAGRTGRGTGCEPCRECAHTGACGGDSGDSAWRGAVCAGYDSPAGDNPGGDCQLCRRGEPADWWELRRRPMWWAFLRWMW